MLHAIATYVRHASAAVAVSDVTAFLLRLLFEIEGD